MEHGDFTALPQRPQRQRRSSKRPKVDDGEPTPTEPSATASGSAAATAAAASESHAGLGSGQQHQHQHSGEMLQRQHDAHQILEQQQQQREQGEGASGADATPPAAQLDLPAYRSAAVGDYKFEYLDHTADVQLHAWGETLREAFENVALCMFNYMTPLKGIIVDPAQTREGERFDRERHACGTEVKAITYSAMQINEAPGDAEVFVIVDI